jgi:hypothetical protein
LRRKPWLQPFFGASVFWGNLRSRCHESLFLLDLVDEMNSS